MLNFPACSDLRRLSSLQYPCPVGPPATIRRGFVEEFRRLLYSYEEAIQEYVEGLSETEAYELGRQAARTVFAPLIWGVRVGDRWDVRESSEFLGISRQALYKRVRSGTALGVSGNGTTWFPAWQFNLDRRLLRPVVAHIIAAFRGADRDLDPLVISAWATKATRILASKSPAEWIRAGGDDTKVVIAARRAAAPLGHESGSSA